VYQEFYAWQNLSVNILENCEQMNKMLMGTTCNVQDRAVTNSFTITNIVPINDARYPGTSKIRSGIVVL
jgi:hypothetical protein